MEIAAMTEMEEGFLGVVVASQEALEGWWLDWGVLTEEMLMALMWVLASVKND